MASYACIPIHTPCTHNEVNADTRLGKGLWRNITVLPKHIRVTIPSLALRQRSAVSPPRDISHLLSSTAEDATTKGTTGCTSEALQPTNFPTEVWGFLSGG